MFCEIIINGMLAVFGLFVLNSVIDCLFNIDIAQMVVFWIHKKIYGEKPREGDGK